MINYFIILSELWRRKRTS